MKKLILLIGIASCSSSVFGQLPSVWKSHDMQRPRAPVVRPAAQSLPVSPPSDAVVLFDGKDLLKWRSEFGGPAGWKLEDGYVEVVAGSGDIRSRDGFGDVQLHIEWMIPVSEGLGQWDGNSGVFLMKQYEVQVLNSFGSDTYADGQAGALYGQFPPLANAALPRGTWQAYDIVFRRPRFDHTGELLQRARLTVFHNGVLIQDCAELAGPTDWLHPKPYTAHPDRLPLKLQDHGAPVRFRNIWLRRLSENSGAGPAPEESAVLLMSDRELARYVGRYEYETGGEFLIRLEGGILLAGLHRSKRVELVPRSESEFDLRWTAARLVFDLDRDGTPAEVTLHIGLEQRQARRVH